MRTSTFHLHLSAILILVGKSRGEAISWINPTNGDTYSTGDKITVKWKVESPIVSPSLRLCLFSTSNRDEDCGATSWPTVREKANIYSMSLAVPNMKYEDRYFLQMQDDLGSKFDSPSFCLIPTPTEGPHAADEPQSPLAPTGKHHALHIDSPSQVTTQSSATPSPTMTTSTTPSSTSAAPSSSATTSNLLITRKSPTTAAFAIPLSVVAFVFIVAAALSFRHRHNIAKQRIEDAEKLILSRNNSKSSYKSTDAGNTLNVLTREDEAYSSAQIPVPLFMPVDLPLPRAAFQRSAKKVLPPSPTYTTPSVQGTMRSSRPLSTRSIYSQSSAYLPPIVPTSRGLFAEERENPATHSVIANYFQPSPPLSPSMPSRPVSVYAPDAESLPSQESGPAGDRPRS